MDPRELIWLRRTRDLSQRLGSEGDAARLPPLILRAAVELTEAQRAFLVRVDPKPEGGVRLEVLATHGFSGNALAGPAGEISRTVVHKTLADGGQAVITSRPRDAELIEVSSVAGRGVLSLVSVPLRLRGETIGVLYLDHCGERELFRESDLPTLSTFATQAAISLELARALPAPAPLRSAPNLRGQSPAIEALRAEVARVGLTLDPVLVCGETGTEGLEVARAVHVASSTVDEAFTLLCAGDSAGSLGPRLLEALAAEGTLCLEETEALDPELQRVLARALASGEVYVPGGRDPVRVRARLVALASADLAERCRAGGFRRDLYYRLDVQRLVVPPLRQRREDLPAHANTILAQLGKEPSFLPSEVLEALERYAWPGNLLELEAELRRLVSTQRPRVYLSDLSEAVREGRGVVHDRPSFSGKTLGELEEELVRAAMRDCEGVKARAARQLGVPRSTLYHLLERYGVE